MQDETTPDGATRHETESQASDPSRALPVPTRNALPSGDEAGRRTPELRRIGDLLEEAAGLTLDLLDVTGDLIAERLGLRRSTPEGRPESQ